MESKSESNIIQKFNDYDITILGNWDEPWFIAKDVAQILGYSNTTKAISNFVKSNEKKSYQELTGNEGPPIWGTLLPTVSTPHPQTVLINENGLYSLVFRSKTKIAEEFREWVKTVLKELRLKGKYELSNQFEAMKLELEQNFNQKLLQNEQKQVQLESTLEEKVNEIQNLKKRRVLIEKPRKDNKHITISERILSLEYMTGRQLDYIHENKIIHIDGHDCKVINPSFKNFNMHYLRLSGRLSRAYQKAYNKKPDIEKIYRRNNYTREFFKNIGDEVIKKYFIEFPLQDWGIDWGWGNRHNEQAPEYNQAGVEEEEIIDEYPNGVNLIFED